MATRKFSSRRQRERSEEDFVAILGEAERGDDRTTAIVAAAHVEANLARALLNRFRTLTTDDENRIFDDRGILCDFASKIELGYLLNVYGHLVREDLNQLRHIRNRFAHDLEVRDFDHPEIARRCDALHARRFLDALARPKHPVQPTRREIFRETAAHFGARFDLETHHRHRPPQGAVIIVPEY